MDTNETFEILSAFAASWGMIYFAILFFLAIAYALWPSRKEQFERAAQIPLSED